MTTSTRNLGYQFYFLFRTYWWKDDQFMQEPWFPGKFGQLGTIGIQIDNDKRLFCHTAPPGKTPLSDWQTHLKAGWQDILQTYAKAFNLEDADDGMKPARTYCLNNLLGVVLLITDDRLDDHEVAVDLYNPQTKQFNPIHFIYDNTVLLSIQDKSDKMPAPATFHAFKPIQEHRVLKADNWTLQPDEVNLLPIQAVEGPNYPIFLVYGLAHDDAATADEQGQHWPLQLQSVLLKEIGDGPLKKTALLNSVAARLIISESVFEMLDWEARRLRKKLQRQTTQYFLASKKGRIAENPDSVLEQDLREMEELIADTDFYLGRLNQAITTLEVNRDNFSWRLNHLQHEELDWQLNWQLGDRQPPLLEPLYADIRNLQTHVTYIEGKLTHLKGLRNQWHSYISENRHDWAKHLSYLVHVIIFLVTLAEMGNVLSYDPNQTDYWNQLISWLRHPAPYLIVIVFYVIFLLLPAIFKKWIKKLRYHWR